MTKFHNARQCFIECIFLSSLIVLAIFPFWKSLGVVPNFLSIVIYLWTLYRPDLISRRLFIVLGICRDGIMGYPLGVGIIELMIVSMIAQIFRRYVLEKGFWTVFLGFMVFTFLNNLLFWSVINLSNEGGISILSMARPILANMLFYPIISLLSLKVQHLIDTPAKGNYFNG